jgi:cell division protein FtsL
VSKKSRAFVPVWTLAVIATASAFCVHLALRSRNLELGYELGRARAEEAKLQETKRVLELEAASYKTPSRVDMVARTLLGMEQAPPERIVSLDPHRPAPMPASSADKPAAQAKKDE